MSYWQMASQQIILHISLDIKISRNYKLIVIIFMDLDIEAKMNQEMFRLV